MAALESLTTSAANNIPGVDFASIDAVVLSTCNRSEIYVETADPRLEDLTLDYRDMVLVVED